MQRKSRREVMAWGALLLLGFALQGCVEANPELKEGPSLAERAAAAKSETNPVSRADSLLQIANQQLTEADSAGAVTTLTAAASAISTVNDKVERARLYADLAERFGRAQKTDEAQAALAQAQTGLGKLEDPLARVKVLVRIAFAQAAFKDHAAAAQTISTAKQTAASLPDAAAKCRGWLELARAEKFFGRNAGVDEAFAAATAAAKATEPQRTACDLLGESADLQLKMERIEPAKAQLAEAAALTANIPDLLSRGFALLKLAELYSLAGSADDCEKLIQQTERLLPQIADKDLQKDLREQAAEIKKRYSSSGK